MTSPNINKPVSGPEVYDTVYERGRAPFGQDLTEASIRAMLSGQSPGGGGPGSSIGSELSSMANEFFTGMSSAVMWAGSALINGVLGLLGLNQEKLPPLWQEFSDDVFKALEPIYSMADAAIDQAKDSQEAAEKLTEQLTGSVNGDFADAIENYMGALGMLALHVDEVQAQIPEITAAAEAITKAEQDVAAAVKDFDATVVAVGILAEAVDESNEEYQAKVTAAEEAAIRVEIATEEYDRRIEDAELLLLDMAETQKETSASAQEVKDLLGSEEWNEAVTGFIFWQDQLNSDQSDFNQGVKSALDALDMVADDQSKFNQGVQDALWVQDQVNQSQSEFNIGVQAALDALDMVTDSQSEFNKGVTKAIDALDTFANLQSEVNDSVEQSLKDLANVTNLSQIHWQTQTEYNETNNEINRAQTEALALHENQLTLLQDTLPRSWVFYTSNRHTRSPWLSCRIVRYSSSTTKDYVEIVALGSWRGRIVFSIGFENKGLGGDSAVDEYDFLVNGSTGASRQVLKEAGAAHMGIKNCVVTIYPYWGNSKREFLLKPNDNTQSPGFGFIDTTAYVNDLEGNPISWTNHRSAVFNGKRMVADARTRVANPSNGSYILRNAGYVIPAGHWIRATDNKLVTFTEY